MILFFDTETTGLMPGRIIQLSYVMQSEEGVRAKNFYFYVDYIEPSAMAVHGLTPEMLFELSSGHSFSTEIDEIYDDFLSADLVVSHNFAFDLKFMIAEFLYQDRQFRYRESLCTMKYFTDVMRLPRKSGRGFKYPKLSELAEYLDIYPYDISRENINLFGDIGKSHDARYDTTTVYLAFNRGADNDEKLGEIRAKYLKTTTEE